MPSQQPIQVREIAVSRLPVNHRGDWVFVALTDAEGRVGYGEASHSTDDAAAIALLEGPLVQQIVGRAWDDPAAAWQILDEAAPVGTARRVSATAASAVEQALWDLRAQQAGVTLASLLGSEATSTTVPLYANDKDDTL